MKIGINEFKKELFYRGKPYILGLIHGIAIGVILGIQVEVEFNIAGRYFIYSIILMILFLVTLIANVFFKYYVNLKK
jgi:hypothetical protein